MFLKITEKIPKKILEKIPKKVFKNTSCNIYKYRYPGENINYENYAGKVFWHKQRTTEIRKPALKKFGK